MCERGSSRPAFPVRAALAAGALLLAAQGSAAGAPPSDPPIWIGSWGEGLYLAYGVDTDSTGHVYVADHVNWRIVKLSPELEKVHEWPVGYYANGVSVDALDQVYALTSYTPCVRVFDGVGNPVRSWGSSTWCSPPARGR